MGVSPNGGSPSPIGVSPNKVSPIRVSPIDPSVQMGVVQFGVVQLGSVQMGVDHPLCLFADTCLNPAHILIHASVCNALFLLVRIFGTQNYQIPYQI